MYRIADIIIVLKIKYFHPWTLKRNHFLFIAHKKQMGRMLK